MEAPANGPRPPKSWLIEPFEAYFRDRVTAWPDLSGQRPLREIEERAHRGGYSTVTDFLHEVRPLAVRLHQRRYEAKLGQQVHVDVDVANFDVEITDAPSARRVV